MNKSQLMDLIAQKDQLQKTLLSLTVQIQNIDKAKDFNKGLVDAQGFPRQDLDFGELCQYRNLKRRKAQLNNDHVAVMKKIQSNLFEYHKTLPPVQGNSEVVPSFSKKKQQIPVIIHEKPKDEYKIPEQKYVIDYLTPFAKITLVQNGSPADLGGIKVKDLLSEFGEVIIYTPDNIKQIPYQVKEDHQVKIVVMRPLTEQIRGNYQKIFTLKDKRQYAKVQLKITPQKWSGRGLMGCKIDPL